MVIGKKPGVLTQREQEVLVLLAEGYNSEEVAKILNVSKSTTDTHKARIMHRLQLTDLASLIKYAIHNGYTSIDKHRSQGNVL
ncbi:MAG: two component transcriptional regulator (LuxR family protein) [bacterium]|nr:MAG: two component transcriptional regulator (LuxR family protein) [bacterium]